MLKYMLLSLLSLAAGLALSRWTQQENVPPANIPAPAVSTAPAPSPKNLRAEALAGERWKDAAKQWAEEDPAGFHLWLLSQDPAPDLEMTKLLFQTWVLRDPDAAFTAAVNLPARFQRGEFIPGMLNALLHAGTHDALALRWVDKVSGEYSGFGWGDPAFIKNKPPEQAAALLNGVSGSSYGGILFHRVGERWAAQDLDGARRWMDTLPRETRALALQGIMQVWARKDVQGALNYLAHEAGTAGRQLIYAPLTELVKHDPAAAFQWWEENMGVPDSNTTRHMLGEWRRKDADAARQYVLGIEDPTLRRQFLKDYAADIGEGAGAFAMSLPPGEDRNAAALEIAFSWARNDRDGAMAFLRTEPDSQAGRDAAAGMVSGLGYNDPAAAFTWANEVPEALRERAVTAALESWRSKDALAAAAAVRAMSDGPLKTAAEQALGK